MRRLACCLLLLLPTTAWAANPNSVVITTATVSVGNSTTPVLAADPARSFVLLVNDSDTNLYCKFGAAASAHAGVLLVANGGGLLLDTTVSQQAVNCVTLTGSGKLLLVNTGK